MHLICALAILMAMTSTCFASSALGPEALARLDKETSAAMAAARIPGVSVAIVHGSEVVLLKGYGVADRRSKTPVTPDTVFRIGSVTKVFTATLLMMLRDEGLLQPDDPVRRHLPVGTTLPKPLPGGARDMTLRHLVTHTSGLPRLPLTMPGSPMDPYGNMPVELVLRDLAKTKLEYPTGMQHRYSNLGTGLLGIALSQAAGSSYETLLRERLLVPLGLTATSLGRIKGKGLVYAQGYSEVMGGLPVPEWSLGALSPAGEMRSNARDMALFLAMHAAASQDVDTTPVLRASLLEMQRPQFVFDGWSGAAGVGWMIRRDKSLGEVVWHNGAVSGFSSWVGFNRRDRVGVVVLTNRMEGADSIGPPLLRIAVESLAPRPKVPDHVRAAAERVRNAIGNQGLSRAEVESLFTKDFLEAVPAENVLSLFASLREDVGKVSAIEIEPVRRGVWRVRGTADSGGEVVFELSATRENPPRIASLLFPE